MHLYSFEVQVQMGVSMSTNLKNVMEDIVIAKVDEILPTLNCCTCTYCKDYIISQSLNHLPPLYVTTAKDYLLEKTNILNNQFHVDILVAIVSSANEIKMTPRHPHFIYTMED